MPTKLNKNKNKANKQKKTVLNKIKGSGAYNMGSMVKSLKQSLKPVLKDIISEGGNVASSLVSKHTGSDRAGMLVKRMANRLGKLIGSGDYEVSDMCEVNSLFKRGSPGMSNASFYNTEMGTRVVHREFISDVFTGPTAGTFNNFSAPINPGLPFAFPYLAAIAQNFEEYRFHGLVFEFISTTSPYNAYSSIGSVIMSMKYDANSPNFTSKPQMENSDFAISTRFDKSLIYGVECKENAQNSYYVRSANSITQPVNLTDLGNFQIATQPASTFPTLSQIGELWVSYDVELLRPRISPERYGFAHYRPLVSTSITGVVSTIGPPTLAPNVYGGLVGMVVSYPSTGGINLSYPYADAGDTYLIQVNLYTSTAPTGMQSPTVSSATNMSGVTIYNNNTQSTVSSVSSSSLQYCFQCCYSITSESQTPNLTIFPWYSDTSAIGWSGCDIIVTDLGNGFTASTL
jgi:hypothetical protein